VGGYMNDNDVLSEYFEVKSGDVYYTFKGDICCRLKGGMKNPLYGKTINLSEMYDSMMDDIISMITIGEFFKDQYLNKWGHGNLTESVSKYTINKYGISLEWLDKVLNGRIGSIDCDRLYECMIGRVGSIAKIDWLSIYTNANNFQTHNDDIWMCIAKEILKNDIYKYFVDRYNLRVTGIEIRNLQRTAVLEWDGGNRRSLQLSDLLRNKKHWWRRVTRESKTRGNIRDYDVLLNGRSEVEVLPDVCPIDNNIVLNYTRIDFSVDNDNNITECKSHIGIDGEKTWSSASIDRIDSTKEYDHDNIEIISMYYNTQVKNCASVHQISKLNMYQIDKMVKSIHRNEVEFSKLSDKELLKYISLYESVLCTYDVILDKTSRYMDEYKRRNPEVFEENVDID
jgi:hypothetical protein